MNHSDTDLPVAEEVIVVEQPEAAETNHNGVVTTPFLLQCICHFVSVAAIRLRCGLVTPVRHLWTNYYHTVAFGEEEGVVMPPRSALPFIVNALLAFAEIKSQGIYGFPFQTHSKTIMVSVSSLLMYGLASVAQIIISSAGFDHTSVYVIIAQLGRITSLCILVISLACLFYF